MNREGGQGGCALQLCCVRLSHVYLHFGVYVEWGVRVRVCIYYKYLLVGLWCSCAHGDESGSGILDVCASCCCSIMYINMYIYSLWSVHAQVPDEFSSTKMRACIFCRLVKVPALFLDSSNFLYRFSDRFLVDRGAILQEWMREL